ncbi:MAG: siderophore-interacting protein [Corynebacterium variabile]
MNSDNPEYVPREHKALVKAVERVSAGMIRVTLGGEDMTDYPTKGIGDEYTRLVFSKDPNAPRRVYTIRHHRTGEVDVDFVIHDGGIAATWALQAQPGQAIGIGSPSGPYSLPETATRQILIVDEPGLPAALRIAELTAADVPTTVIAEVRGKEYEMAAEVPGGTVVEYTWLHGTGNGHSPSQLEEVVRRLDIDDDTYVWVATEAAMQRALRSYVRHELGLHKGSYTCLAYWRERGEEWRERYNEVSGTLQPRIAQLWEDKEGDSEDIIDEVERMYREAGL